EQCRFVGQRVASASTWRSGEVAVEVAEHRTGDMPLLVPGAVGPAQRPPHVQDEWRAVGGRQQSLGNRYLDESTHGAHHGAADHSLSLFRARWRAYRRAMSFNVSAEAYGRFMGRYSE